MVPFCCLDLLIHIMLPNIYIYCILPLALLFLINYVSYKGSVDKYILLVSGMLVLGKLHLICRSLFNQNITFYFMLLLRPKLSESILLPEDTTKLLLYIGSWNLRGAGIIWTVCLHGFVMVPIGVSCA